MLQSDRRRIEVSRRTLATLLASVFFFAAACARADSPAPDLRQRAAELFDRGVAALDRGDAQAALTSFREANSLVVAPEAAWNIVVAEVRLELYAAAHRDLSVYLASPEKPSPERRREATEVLRKLEAKLAHLSVVALAPGATVIVDGVASEPDLRVEPGNHRVRVTTPGRAPVEKLVSVRAGERLEVDLTPVAAPARPPLVPPPVRTPVELPAPDLQRKAGLGFLGVGGGALLTGGILAGVAFMRLTDANRMCTPRCENAIEESAQKAWQQEAADLTSAASGPLLGGALLAVIGAHLAYIAPPAGPASPAVKVPPVAVVPLERGFLGVVGGAF